MHAMPFVVWLRPVRSDERVGEQSAVVCQFVYVRPLCASLLMFGVSISPPHGSIAEKPTSSRTMYRTFGAPSGAAGWRDGSQSGTESRSSTSILPLNCLLIAVSFGSRVCRALGCGRQRHRSAQGDERRCRHSDDPAGRAVEVEGHEQ